MSNDPLECHITYQRSRDSQGKCGQCGFPPSVSTDVSDGYGWTAKSLKCIFRDPVPRCPKCKYSDVHYRVTFRNWICRRCGFSEFTQTQLDSLSRDCERDRANYFGSEAERTAKAKQAEYRAQQAEERRETTSRSLQDTKSSNGCLNGCLWVVGILIFVSIVGSCIPGC